MATNFENRIDYIDISAFGVGQVDEKAPVSKTEIEQLEQGQDKEKRLFQRIQNLDKRRKDIAYSVCSLADR